MEGALFLFGDTACRGMCELIHLLTNTYMRPLRCTLLLPPHGSCHTKVRLLADGVSAVRCRSETQVQLTSGVTFHKHGIVSEAGLAAAGDEYTTLPRSMAANNASWIDILKIDIEGGEWSVFAELLDSGAPLPFTQVMALCCHGLVFGQQIVMWCLSQCRM